MKINGKEYTKGNVEAAIRCADWVATAYARASEDNCGGGSIDWDVIDYAHEAAREALSDEYLAEITRQARLDNDFGADTTT